MGWKNHLTSSRRWKNCAGFLIPCLGISKANVQPLNDKLPALWLISTFRDAVMKSLRSRRGKQICNIFYNITCMSQGCLGWKCHHSALGLLFHSCPLRIILPFMLRCPFVSTATNRALEPDGLISSSDAGRTRAQHLVLYYLLLYIVYN